MDCGVCVHISWENSRALTLNIVTELYVFCSAYQQCHRKILCVLLLCHPAQR